MNPPGDRRGAKREIFEIINEWWKESHLFHIIGDGGDPWCKRQNYRHACGRDSRRSTEREFSESIITEYAFGGA